MQSTHGVGVRTRAAGLSALPKMHSPGLPKRAFPHRGGVQSRTRCGCSHARQTWESERTLDKAEPQGRNTAREAKVPSTQRSQQALSSKETQNRSAKPKNDLHLVTSLGDNFAFHETPVLQGRTVKQSVLKMTNRTVCRTETVLQY